MKRIIVLIICCLGVHSNANSQVFNEFLGMFPSLFPGYNGDRDARQMDDAEEVLEHSNVFKINLMSLPFSTVSAQYERVRTNQTSLCLGLRYQPETQIPVDFGPTLTDLGADTFLKSSFANFKLSNFAITPEFRFYLKQDGKGFYIAPFARYEQVNLSIPLNNKLNSGRVLNSTLTGARTNIGGGIQLGAQFNLNKRFVLDWWIVGAYFGSNATELSFEDANLNLSASEITNLESILAIDIPILTTTPTITTDKIQVNNSGSSPSIRTGLCLGFRF
jgi:hypothetical protein